MSAQYLSIVSSTVVNGVTYFSYSPMDSDDYQSFEGSSCSYDVADVAGDYWNQYGTESTSDFSEDEQFSTGSSDLFLENWKNLTPEEVHSVVLGWRLTAEERNINGYPGIGGNREGLRAVVPPTVFDNGKRMWIGEHETKRKCCRCAADFEVNANGDFPVEEGVCRFTDKGKDEAADSHVTAQKFASELLKFVTAPLPAGRDDSRSKEVYALDCEMVWTIAGPSLARMSLVSMDGELVLDLFVKPPFKVVDCCTQYSGLTMDDVERAEETIESAQSKLFEFVNSNTILVGHSLESDLKALQLVHWNTVDTALIYADDFGNKVALRELTQKFLGRKIQEDNAEREGHCSFEDALACIDLIKYKINYDF